MSLYEPADIPENPSAQLQVVLKWVDAIEKWDVDGLSSTMGEEYKHHILPKTLASAAPTRSRSEFLQYISEVSSMFKEWKITIHEVTECPGKVILHATSNGMSTTGHPYNNEYIMTIHLKERLDGQHEIVAMKEFVDSKFALEFFGGERQRQAGLKKTGAVTTTILKYSKVASDGKIKRLRRECPSCGAGIFMAFHKDTEYCGKCGLTYTS